MASVAGLAVVVVNFNTREHLRTCLRAISAESSATIVVADNGSTDGSVEMVGREFPSVVIDVDASNPGYGSAANRGIRRSAPADVLLLNSDTRVCPGALTALAAYLAAHPRAAIVGPRLLGTDGRLRRSTFSFPSPLRLPCASSPLGWLLQRIPPFRERCLATWSHTYARRVPYVVGAAMAIRREAFDAVGGFDESFFMYGEEIDLCFRLGAISWETHFTPTADVMHVGGASAQCQRAAMLEQGCASIERFYRHHYSGVPLGLARLFFRSAMAARFARDVIGWMLASDQTRRTELAENASVWRRALAGHAGAPGSE